MRNLRQLLKRFLGKVAGPSCNGLSISGEGRALRDRDLVPFLVRIFYFTNGERHVMSTDCLLKAFHVLAYLLYLYGAERNLPLGTSREIKEL